MHINEFLEYKLKQVFNDVLGIDTSKISLHTSFNDDLSIDSLDFLELIVNLEKEFGIAIPDTHVRHLKTYGELLSYLKDNVTVIKCIYIPPDDIS